MSPSSVVRKSITIPADLYEKLIDFKDENEIFSHFCTRIFELFLERSHMAMYDRIGISRSTFNKLIEVYPKEKIIELVQSLETGLEKSLGKKIKSVDLEREIAPYLKKVLVDINNIFTTLSFNFLEGQKEFQLMLTHKSTDEYADFWADYLTGFFNDRGYSVAEQEKKKGYLYIHFNKGK